MRILFILVLVLSLHNRASATTLDPSHPIWDAPDTDVSSWLRALRDARAERAPGLKWHEAPVARGRAAAVGRRVLVIPVVPADAGTLPRTREELIAGWVGDGEGSVRGYWSHVSAGELELEVRVLPWLEVPGTLQSDYPNVIEGNPVNLTAGPRRLARDALAAAARLVEDLHAFDDDGPDGVPGSGDDDGVLDLVVVLHPFPGWEVEPIDVERGIVSIQASLGGAPIEGTSLRGDAFVVASASSPLGVWVHEFGHLLGLPDLYDLDRSPLPDTPGGPGPQGGLGRWSLMASGTWGDDGKKPAGLDAWSRTTLGFGLTSVLAQASSTVLDWVDVGTASALRIEPLGDWSEEVFLVEARRRRDSGVVDGALPGDGALVYRVRPDLSKNLIASKFVELLQADGRADLDTGDNDGDATDPFDGSAERGLLDGNTNPSSESAIPSASRTPPSLEFSREATGMRVDLALASGAALRLHTLGVADDFVGTRTYLRPGEQQALLQVRFSSVGALEPGAPNFTIANQPGGRALVFEPATPIPLVRDGDVYVLETPVSVSDPGDPTQPGEAKLILTVQDGASGSRTIEMGFPVSFTDGLPADAMARFVSEFSTAGPDTTRFARLPLVALPRPAFVGYELNTGGEAGYANSVEASLTSPWFAITPEAMAWLWTRGSTEQGIPGQVFDGAAFEFYVPDRGWQSAVPDGDAPVYVARRSGATTRDRLGFGGDRPEWVNWSVPLPERDLPIRVRVRFGSDASITGGPWQVAGLQTSSYPRAIIELGTARGGEVVATARLSGDFSRVDAGRYQYRRTPESDWAPASGFFSLIPTDQLTVALDLIPDDVLRAEVALFSGTGAASYQLGSAGLRRDPAPRLPTLVRNPNRGLVELQTADLSAPSYFSIYDVRGRRRARLVVPPRTTWLEWVPRADNGAILSSGVYFLRADGTDSGSVRFTWFR
jgi:immune inhibitor A